MTKKHTFFIFLMLLLGLNSAFATVQQREISPVKLDKISERLYQILGGRGANGGIYIGDTGVLVIDSKMTKESVDQVLTEIKKLTDKPVKYLVNTHSDGDHIAGNQFFPKSVVFVAHENCRRDFFLDTRSGEKSAWFDPKLAPFVPSITYLEKMVIRLGEPVIELWYFGIGHTTGDTVVYFPEEKTAFLGDQIFMGRPQLIHSYKGGNSFQHVKALSKMLQTIAAEKFCSGHGAPIDRAAVEHHIAEMKSLQDKIISLKKKGRSMEEIKASFPENHSRLVESIFNEIKLD